MKKLNQRIKYAFELFGKNGLSSFGLYARRRLFRLRQAQRYRNWIRKYGTLSDERRAEIRTEIVSFTEKPLISVVMPVYNVEERWLRLCIESVLKQIYENWELCIADDCSPSPHIRRVLEEFAARDARIKLFFREENGHISAASNSALELATGEFTALLDHDDELTEDALFCVAKAINDFPETAFIYSDEDMIDARGRRYEPKFKPDFSWDLFCSLNLITHLSAYRTDILRKIGGFRLGAEGSQDYDLALRVAELIDERRIRHIPRILYHWRAVKGSVALSGDEKPYAHERAREAIAAHLERAGKKASVTRTVWNLHRVQYELPLAVPKCSLIVYNSASEDQIVAATDYGDFESFAVVDAEAESLNKAATEATGDVLCFVDAGLKPLTADWLRELVGFAIQKEIGAVGAKILDTDESVLHGGFVIGTDETVSSAFRGFRREDGGSFGRGRVIGNFSAVSVSCFCLRRDLFEEIGGFDAENLPTRFFDADLCLKLREKGLRIVFTPYAELQKLRTSGRLNLELAPSAEEKRYFAERWRDICARDPFYNPNLSRKDGSFSIAVESKQ